MANELTTHSTPSPLGLLSSRSEHEITAALSTPVDQARLARAIRDLLGLYWIASDTPEERVRQVALFVKDLAAYPEAAVAYAVHEWRTTQDRRPSIASLMNLVHSRVRALSARAEYLRGLNAPPAIAAPSCLSPEERAKRAAFLAETIASVGLAVRAPQ